MQKGPSCAVFRHYGDAGLPRRVYARRLDRTPEAAEIFGRQFQNGK